jgi:hypothetical protein
MDHGNSYSSISNDLTIPKSTLSTWRKNLGKPVDKTKQFEHLFEARKYSAITKNAQKKSRINEASALAKEELEHIPLSDKSITKALLAMLYWAEGSKGDKSSSLKFVNTDPLLLSFYITMLREVYPIKEEGLRVGLQIHSYHDPDQAIAFWSETLHIKSSQFWKIYVKKRSETKKFRNNFQGICSVYYGNRMIRDELISLGSLLAHKKLPSFNG